GSGHNDVLVGLSVAGALALLAGPAMARARTPGTGLADPGLLREVAASAVLTLGALVKTTAAIPLVLLVIGSIWRRPRPRRPGVVVAHGAVIGALVAVCAAPFMQTKDPTLGLSTLATHVGWLAPLRFFRVLLPKAAASLWGQSVASGVESAVRFVFWAAFALVFLLLATLVVRVATTWAV